LQQADPHHCWSHLPISGTAGCGLGAEKVPPESCGVVVSFFLGLPCIDVNLVAFHWRLRSVGGSAITFWRAVTVAAVGSEMAIQHHHVGWLKMIVEL